jgi:hypothetical protein
MYNFFVSCKNTCCKNRKKSCEIREKGFSLIELSMALLFIAFVMIFLITTLVSVMRTYNKGVWLSQINQAGRQINSDIGDRARFADKAIYVKDANRLCVGGVAYLWNTAEDIKLGDDGKMKAKNWFEGESSETNLRLVRVTNPTGSLCTTSTTSRPKRSGDSNVTVLLGTGATIQKFAVESSTVTNLTKITAVFSTTGDNQPTLSDDGKTWTCLDKYGHNQYCAFMQLNLTVFGRGEWK